MELALQLFSIVAPVFVCGAIGFTWALLDLPFDGKSISALVLNVGLPCLIFHALVSIELSMEEFGEMVKVSLVYFAIIGAVAAAILKATKRSVRTFLPGILVPNGGNLGLPICLFAFGDKGLVLGVTFFAILLLIQSTVGIAIAVGRVSLTMLVTTPIFYSVALAVIVMATDFEVPLSVARTIELIGGFPVPVMLIALGVSLAGFKVSLLGNSLLVALIRLGLGYVVGVGIAWYFELGHVMAGVLILQAVMPVAVMSYMLELRFGRDPESIAGAVVISTLLSIAILPLVLASVL